jgi:hypothetical protein
MGYDTYLTGDLAFHPALADDDLKAIPVVADALGLPFVDWLKGDSYGVAYLTNTGFHIDETTRLGDEFDCMIAWLADHLGRYPAYMVTGSIWGDGEESDDFWELRVTPADFDAGRIIHKVTFHQGHVVYDPDGTEITPEKGVLS